MVDSQREHSTDLAIHISYPASASEIGGLHCCHVGVQNIKMEVNSQRREILSFLNTNMAVMTPHAHHQ